MVGWFLSIYNTVLIKLVPVSVLDRTIATNRDDETDDTVGEFGIAGDASGGEPRDERADERKY